MSSSLMKSAEAVIQLGAEATREADPLALSIARILLVATLVGAPWAFGAVGTWAWVSLGLVACLALFLWALGSVQQGALKFIWSPLYIPLAMFFLLGLAQYGARLTFDTSETREALVLLAADVIFFFLTVQLFSRAGSETWRRFGLTVLLFAGSLGLFAILQFASGARRIYGMVDTPGYVLFGPYANPDHYAGLMEMLIPVGFFSVAERNRRHSVLALLVLVTVAVASLLLSGSRGGLFALLAEIVIAGAILRRVARSRQRWGFAITVAAAILSAVLLFSWVAPDWIVKRLGSVVTIGSPGWLEGSNFRKSVASDSLRMLRDHPVLGVGLGSFETAYPRYQSFSSDLWIDHAHNDYAEAVAETGLIGAVLIFSALALFFRLAFRDWSPRLGSGGSWIRLGAALGCCGLLVHSFFDFNLHIPANAAWFAVLAGMATTEEQLSKSGHNPSPHSKAA
jgi:O-antigen ligase